MRLRISASALALTLAATLHAQTPSKTPSMADIDRARLEVSRLEELVKQGAVAKNRLDQAKAKIEDAEDDAILRRTLFGQMTIQDLNAEQIEEMIAAAKRRVDRMTPRLETLKKLADEGIIARTEISPELEELDLRKRTLDLAEARARTFADLLAAIRAEEEAETRAAEAREKAGVWRAAERYDGNGRFQITMLKVIEQAFEKKFQKQLPISALGMTELHRTLGFDHRERVDVALTPDSPEGIWLRKLLEGNRVPYVAFRTFVPGQATAPHIHIGPPSLRLPRTVSGL